MYNKLYITSKGNKKMAKTAKKKASAKASKVSKVEAPVVETPETAPDVSGLSIADLQAIAQVIDMAVRRGAFGASEVTEVGAIYTKLTTFLQVIADQQRAAEGSE